jgi:hypothetical protein
MAKGFHDRGPMGVDAGSADLAQRGLTRCHAIGPLQWVIAVGRSMALLSYQAVTLP